MHDITHRPASRPARQAIARRAACVGAAERHNGDLLAAEEPRSFNDRAIHAAQCPTIVLLHSSASSSRQWDALIEMLQPRFHVHAVDFHGHGARPQWRGDAPLSLADDASLVTPLIAAAGGAHIVGHSYGAAVALKLAVMHPNLVHSLVAYEPVLSRWLIDDAAHHRLAQEFFAVGESIRNRLARNQEHAAAQQFIDLWAGAGAWAASPRGRQRFIATRMRAVLQHFDALRCEPLQRAQVAGLSIPMLFMAGAQTVAVTRRLAEILRRALPRADHQRVEGAGHMGPITAAAMVNRRIAAFLHALTVSASATEPLGDLACAAPRPTRLHGSAPLRSSSRQQRPARPLQLKSQPAAVKPRCNCWPRPFHYANNDCTEHTMKNRNLNEQLTTAALTAVATVSWLLITVIAPSASFI